MKITVNADDFGWDKSCSEAILKSFQNGYISTTTTCTNGLYFEEAIQSVIGTEYAGYVGLHLVLTEGIPLTDKMKRCKTFCDEDGIFHGKINKYRPLKKDLAEVVYLELRAQAVRYVKAGMNIHHIDSHHHVHTAPFVTGIVFQIMREFGVKKIRIHRNIGDIQPLKRFGKTIFNQNLFLKAIAYSNYFGSFDDIAENDKLIKVSGTLEIMCHPDIDKNGFIVDRAGYAPYDNPYGKRMDELILKIRN